jgi:hypothetical protein
VRSRLWSGQFPDKQGIYGELFNLSHKRFIFSTLNQGRDKLRRERARATIRMKGADAFLMPVEGSLPPLTEDGSKPGDLRSFDDEGKPP